MTPISLPLTSEQNEREAFLNWFNKIYFNIDEKSVFSDVAYAAWQHQQKRIDELECSVQNWIDFSKKWESLCKEKDGEIESLQAKLTIAVNALEYYADNSTPAGKVGWKALAEINKIGE